MKESTIQHTLAVSPVAFKDWIRLLETCFAWLAGSVLDGAEDAERREQGTSNTAAVARVKRENLRKRLQRRKKKAICARGLGTMQSERVFSGECCKARFPAGHAFSYYSGIWQMT